MASRKRRRDNVCAPVAPEILTALPADVLLEIMARTDFLAVVRCTAVCKHLRRDILCPQFIHGITQKLAPSILAYSSYDEWPLNVAHPVTPAIVSLCRNQLSPYMSRCAVKLFSRYEPVTSRGGLVVLRREHMNARPKSKRSSDMCVYDPMSGNHTFLSRPTGIKSAKNNLQAYVLLTAADGIDCSFMLLFFDLHGWSIKAQAATSSSGTWGPVTTHASNPGDYPWMFVWKKSAPAILRGGVIHWLVSYNMQILTYDVRTRSPGMVKLPPTKGKRYNDLYLATSPDRNLLKLLAIEGFNVSVWLQLHTVPAGGGGGWSLENTIDIRENLRSVCPNIPLEGGTDVVIEFEGSGKRSGDVVLLQVLEKCRYDALVVFDLETKEIHKQKNGFSMLEIDLPYRLQTMKVFS
ncbi:hypothetical protein ZWY2020_000098 [Hordeum vulgare]|nr:hypothetical protein ZWY2020_000098 [Hordeum vulgare]